MAEQPRSYSEKLKDPRWQKRRLEVMERAAFACEACRAKDQTLHVHHKLYRRGADPWDYADHELQCLCETCHERTTALQQTIAERFAKVSPEQQWQVLTYLDALVFRDAYLNGQAGSIQLAAPDQRFGWAWGTLEGIAHAWKMDPTEVRDLFESASDRRITTDDFEEIVLELRRRHRREVA